VNTLAENAVPKIIFVYFAVALMLFLSAILLFPTVVSFLSILLLFPLYKWYKDYSRKRKLSTQIDQKDKGAVLFWIFALFILALIVRIPSVVLFGEPYEKTPFIYLIVLTIVLVEKVDICAFGFKTQKIGKALFYGVAFYAVLGGLTLVLNCFLIYVFTNQLPFTSYDILPFLAALPFHIFCVGISEEGFFRGYAQTHLQKFYFSKAIIIQAFLFGIWHFVWDLSPFNPLDMIFYVANTFLIGLVFGYFYAKAKNLVPLVLAHGLWNSFPQGIIVNEAAFIDLQIISAPNQILVGFLPYIVSVTLTLFFIKYLVKEI